MAQKYYEQTLNSVVPLSSDKTKIEKLIVHVIQQSDSSLVTDLVQADFTISDNTGTLTPTTDWTLDTTDNTNGNYGIVFATGQELDYTNYVVSIINKSGNLSDKLFIDFAQTFDSSGDSTLSYSINSPGTYKFVLDSADGTTLSKASADSYTFNNPPNAANSSISMDTSVLDKPYLAQVISGGTLNVSLLLNLKDADNNSLQGACEVSVYGDMQ